MEVALTNPNAHRTRTVRGMFDSGADYTHLREEWKDRLRVTDDDCIDWQDRIANGQMIPGKLTFLDAALDGHEFRMPVVFMPGTPTDLIGRIGVFDQFAINQDPKTSITTFQWIGATGTPWSVAIEQQWSDQLKTKAKA
jgi:hypothetical protein